MPPWVPPGSATATTTATVAAATVPQREGARLPSERGAGRLQQSAVFPGHLLGSRETNFRGLRTRNERSILRSTVWPKLSAAIIVIPLS